MEEPTALQLTASTDGAHASSGDLVSTYEADLRSDEQTTSSVRSRESVRAEAREESRTASHYRSFHIGN